MTPDRNEALKPAKGILVAFFAVLTIGILILAIVCILMSWATGIKLQNELQLQERKIEHYQKERRIRPEVILIRWDDSMFYYLNGRKCEIRG